MRTLRLALPLFLLLALPLTAHGQSPRRDAVIYEPDTRDPVLKKIKERNEAEDAARAAETEAMRKEQKARKKAKKDSRKVLRATLPEGELPGAPETFVTTFHFEPQAQYYTGTCWSYAATSFMETEIERITGQKIKMSEMHTAYWEYVEKARRFVRERGDSVFAEGSQHNALTRIWKLYGAVPLEAYDGVVNEDGLHDHIRMYREMNDFLQYVKEKELWDEEWVLSVIRSILDRTLGPVPESFTWKGRKYTPRTFVEKVCKVNPDDYVGFMSTLSAPFFQQAEFEVQDNWWHDASYHNVPLDLFYAAVEQSIRNGYSLAIGGDVSEPGKNFRQDVAFVPSCDIPAEYIDQSSREYRIENGTTGDDHGIHLVGYQEVGDTTWFLIKDSGRSARHGKHDGYYFFHPDFVRLKMLSFTVHKDAVKELLEKFQPAPEVNPESEKVEAK
jgi:bleomycin hydrolase